MLINRNVAILSQSLVLVPYQAHHVPTYHAWMQDEELQELTASEPLSIDEEYDMQQRWRKDHDKLTFIICQQQIDDEASQTVPAPTASQLHCLDNQISMRGDINLFLYPRDDEDEPDFLPTDVIGEIELMIAVAGHRGKGLGGIALQTFLGYIATHEVEILKEYAGTQPKPTRISYLRVKIQQSNERSIRLFKKNGFVATSTEANYFGEVELRLLTISDSANLSGHNYQEIGYHQQAPT